jgi:hypothetical protein
LVGAARFIYTGAAMPYYRFQLEVNLPPEVVAERIRAVTAGRPKGFFPQLKERWNNAPNLFWGTVEGTSFSLQRNISYQNSFLPQIKGKVLLGGFGTRLDVTMHLHPAVAVFMLFWLGIVGSVAMPIGYTEPMSLVPLGMLAFGLLLPVAAFFPEAFKAKRLITDLLREGLPQPVD